jgi:hypothetical protein
VIEGAVECERNIMRHFCQSPRSIDINFALWCQRASNNVIGARMNGCLDIALHHRKFGDRVDEAASARPYKYTDGNRDRSLYRTYQFKGRCSAAFVQSHAELDPICAGPFGNQRGFECLDCRFDYCQRVVLSSPSVPTTARLRPARLGRCIATAADSREQITQHHENRSTNKSLQAQCCHGRNAVFGIASARKNLDDKNDGGEGDEDSADTHQRRGNV